MSLRWPLAAVGALIVSVAVLASSQLGHAAPGDGQQARRPAPARPVVPPTQVDVTAEARTAKAGRLVASGPNLRVERVRLAQARSLAAGAAPVSEVLRLTITAQFEVLDAALTVLVDGVPVGRGIESPELTSATAVLPPQVVKNGAAVSFAYGETAPQIHVGTLVVTE